MDWKTLLAYITGTVDQELLLRNESLVTENRLLRQQLKGRVRLSDGERKTLAEIGYKPTTARDPQRERTLVTVLDIVESRYAGTVLQGILVAATAAQAELLLRQAPDDWTGTSATAARAWVASTPGIRDSPVR